MNRSFFTLVSVFFFWGFVAASNTILIGLFKKNFELTQFQSQLVDLAFYTAYFVGSLLYFISSVTLGDPLNKIGYKKGLILGLCISAIGAFGFIPAAGMQSFPVMLVSLFTIGLGFALQQIVANPYVIAVGKPETGAHRVSLAGGINSFGTTIGPLLIAIAIYGGLGGSNNASLFIGDKELKTDKLTVERTSNKSEMVQAQIVSPDFDLKAPNDNGTDSESKKVLFINYSFTDTEIEKIYTSAVRQKEKVAGILVYLGTEEKSQKAIEKQIGALKQKYKNETVPIVTLGDYNPMVQISKAAFGHEPSLPQPKIRLNLLGVEAVKFPSIILGISFLLFSLILGLSKLPPITNTEKMEKNLGALKYPQVILGMLAIFVYVGVEVGVQSNLPELMKQPEILGKAPDQTVHFISLYWGCLMIGRWVGALSAFNLSPQKNKVLTIVVPVIAFGVILLVNYIKGSPMMDLLSFAPFIALLIIAFFVTGGKPARTMIVFGSVAAIMMVIGMLTNGKIALYSFVSGGLFCSVMWPCIFSLSIAGLGKYTSQASALLVMMILGGALIPPFQGLISDYTNIHLSYFIPVICFAVLAWYGWKVKSVLSKQGIDYDQNSSSGH